MPEFTHETIFSSVESARAKVEEDHVGTYTVPWWGDKYTENIKNRGYVIGFKDDAKGARWRLDYDPTKKLHINWVQDVRGSTQRKECYCINALNYEQVMFDYFVGWTKQHYQDIPDDIKQRLGSDKKWWGAYWA